MMEELGLCGKENSESVCGFAALAFVLAFLQQSMLCILLLGFVIVAERDEWTSVR